MQWTSLNDLREKYLSFFEGKGHTRMASAPLIPPKDDTSLLLINSGMAPLKKFFLGQATPPNTRVTTCQKCIRTEDIEHIGKTARHGTYFEMLGNFSFGDYFKHEATAWAWEFITKVLELPVDRLWVTIYQDDDEAFDIWTKEVGVAPERIVRLGKEDNFWEHGSGPCGPCSEIYFDRGEARGCGKPTCGPGCDCDRYVEFWNLVFSQFDSDGEGHYERMAKPNIDTGMGLERIACIMQDVDNLFEVDTVQNIMKKISEIAGVHYGENEKTDISLRVITDHIRSCTFMLADGVTPSNEGRGYVLRRLLRRAARHGKLLGIDVPFLYQVVDTVAHENLSAYPELTEKASYIKKVIYNEEEAFDKTIGKGLDLLRQLMDKVAADNGHTLSGEDVFKLYDTYGFPVDLTQDIVAEKGFTVDAEGFEAYAEAVRFFGFSDFLCVVEIYTVDGEPPFARIRSRVFIIADRVFRRNRGNGAVAARADRSNDDGELRSGGDFSRVIEHHRIVARHERIRRPRPCETPAYRRISGTAGVNADFVAYAFVCDVECDRVYRVAAFRSENICKVLYIFSAADAREQRVQRVPSDAA